MNTIILENTPQGEMAMDVHQRLSNDRILFAYDYISDKLATYISATLLLKDSENPDEKITIFINAEGGDIRSTLMIYDMMHMIQAPVETVCVGSAMDEAAILLMAGTPGLRFATENSIIAVGQLIHDWTNYSDLTSAKKILGQSMDDNKKMMDIIAKCTKKPYKKIIKDFDRRVFMNSQKAAKYGFIDKVIKPSK